MGTVFLFLSAIYFQICAGYFKVIMKTFMENIFSCLFHFYFSLVFPRISQKDSALNRLASALHSVYLLLLSLVF